MVDAPDFQQRVVHKQAGVGRTIVMKTSLHPSLLPEGFVPADSPLPANADDPEVEVRHLMRFRDMAAYPEGSEHPPVSGEEAVAKYGPAAAPIALAMGGLPSGLVRRAGHVGW
jgi:hypothetical protein